MAGKPLVLTSRRLGYALDQLSKHALIDLVTDLARKQIGEDATEEELAEEINEWVRPVLIARADRFVSIPGLMTKLDNNDADYLAKRGRYALTPEYEAKRQAQIEDHRIGEAIKAMPPEQRTKKFD